MYVQCTCIRNLKQLTELQSACVIRTIKHSVLGSFMSTRIVIMHFSPRTIVMSDLLKADLPHPSSLNSTQYYIHGTYAVNKLLTVEAERYTGEQRSKNYSRARSYVIRSVERNISYIIMIIKARNIIFWIFLWHVLKIAGFICIPRRTNILSRFANPVYLVQFIRLQSSRLYFFKVLSSADECEGHFELDGNL